MKGNFTKELTSTTGAVLTLTLAQFSAKYSRFADVHAVGEIVDYVIENGSNWEAGRGTVQAGNTLDRTTPTSSHVAGVYSTGGVAKITLVGDSIVFVGQAAENTFDIYDSFFVNQLYRKGQTLDGTIIDHHVNLGGGTSVTGLAGQAYDYCAVLSGENNSSLRNHSVICGGKGNTITVSSHSFLGSGETNTVSNSAYEAIICGFSNNVSAAYSLIGCGQNNTITGARSTIVNGRNNSVVGGYSGVLQGRGNQVDHTHSQAGGGGSLTRDNFDWVWGATDTSTPSVVNNTVRIQGTGGNILMDGTVSSPEADIGEMMEWADDNLLAEDRIGFFVSLVNGKIVIGNSNTKGIISATASIIGNAAPNHWSKMYLKDKWKRKNKLKYIRHTWDMEIVVGSGQLAPFYVYEKDGVYYDEYPNPGNMNGRIATEIPPLHALKEVVYTFEVNPDFDSSQVYIPRAERKEWDVVGILGIILVHSSEPITGPTVSAGADGKAYNSTTGQVYDVMNVIDDTIVEIFYEKVN